MKSLWFAAFAVLLALKLSGCIDLSWWVVTLPIWGGFAMVGAFVVLALIVVVLAGLIAVESEER